jgi:hypothetical protein
MFDLNGNGDETGGSADIVDRADYDLWKLHYGEGGPASGTAGISRTVPEPSAIAIALLSVMSMSVGHRVRS